MEALGKSATIRRRIRQTRRCYVEKMKIRFRVITVISYNYNSHKHHE